MKRALAIIICCVILRVSGNEEPSEHEELSQETKDTLDAILDFMACVDEGNCNPPIEHVQPVNQKVDKNVDVPNSTEETTPAEHEKVSEVETSRPEAPVEKSPYFTLCQKLGLKLEQQESLHPELESLKFQLLERFDSYASSFTTDCKEGESLVTKILDLVILVAEKLKEDFAGQKHHKRIIVEEIIAEEPESNEIGFVGSVRGIPGLHYPNYTEVPITSFSCSDKKYIPGFYADLETGCQVFHVCYEHRRESFLCPLGTIFNQPILACDYWYSSNCSQSLVYYDVNAKNEVIETLEETKTEEIIETIVEQTKTSEKDLKNLVKFLPVKARIVEFPKEPEAKAVVSSIDGVEEVAANIFGGIISTSTKVTSNARQAVKLFPRPKPVLVMPKVMKPLPLMKAKLAVKAAAAIPLVKAKVAAAAIPIVKAKVAAAAIPVVKAKFVAAAAVPIVKAKVAAAAVPIVKAKVAAAAVPIVKAKVAAAAVPIVKAKVAAAAVPIVKAKVAAAAVPIVKAKVAAAAVPIVKAKVAAAAVPIVKAKVAAAAVPIVKAKAASAAIPVVKAKFVAAAAVPVAKAKVAAAAVPVVKAKFVAAAAVPVAKAKVAAAAIPVVKAKFVTAAAVPVAKAKVAAAAIPVVKAKFVTAAAVPVAKAKYAKAAVVPFFKVKAASKPIFKAKLAAAVPIFKVKKMAKLVPIMAAVKPKLAVPVMKAKLMRSAVISPLTKKALALGYLKLLKAKKLVLLG